VIDNVEGRSGIRRSDASAQRRGDERLGGRKIASEDETWLHNDSRQSLLWDSVSFQFDCFHRNDVLKDGMRSADATFVLFYACIGLKSTSSMKFSLVTSLLQ